MPRSYCPRCAYPLRSCLCAAIRPTRFNTRIVVLQHPAEVKHATNTARLLALVSPATEIVVGEAPNDFAALRERLQDNRRAVVLYPAPDSEQLSDSVSIKPVDTIVLIDGTWRKAKKIWLSNPWLQSMRVCQLNTAASRYHIRRGKQPGGLASIEAAAEALNQLKESDTDALLTAFAALQAKWPVSDHD